MIIDNLIRYGVTILCLDELSYIILLNCNISLNTIMCSFCRVYFWGGLECQTAGLQSLYCTSMKLAVNYNERPPAIYAHLSKVWQF